MPLFLLLGQDQRVAFFLIFLLHHLVVQGKGKHRPLRIVEPYGADGEVPDRLGRAHPPSDFRIPPLEKGGEIAVPVNVGAAEGTVHRAGAGREPSGCLGFFAHGKGFVIPEKEGINRSQQICPHALSPPGCEGFPAAE